jgi:hypothetical protein
MVPSDIDGTELVYPSGESNYMEFCRGRKKMKRGMLSGFVLTFILIIAAGVCSAGDVVYTLWEDDQQQFWVRIQNDTDRTIHVENILIIFYNEKGKQIEQRNAPCKGNCTLSPHDTRDFGPHQSPANTESARVRNVKYSVE